jgi:hypothetical protein
MRSINKLLIIVLQAIQLRAILQLRFLIPVYRMTTIRVINSKGETNMKARKCLAVALTLMMMISAALAQAPSGQKEKSQQAAAATPVNGSGTTGQLSKWLGVDGSNSYTLGDSIIFEDKFGKLGIGTKTPTSLLTVKGMIETTLGGYKFPDGTVQTTAAVTGLLKVAHDDSLFGDGTQANPLGISVPLRLILASGDGYPVLTVENLVGSAGIFTSGGSNDKNEAGPGIDAGGGTSVSSTGGAGVFAIGGASSSGKGGNGVNAAGGSSSSQPGGIGVNASGGFSITASGGSGIEALGGESNTSAGGLGVKATGGDSSNNNGGRGISAVGGIGRGPGHNGGAGIFAAGGAGTNGATTGFAGVFQGNVSVGGNLSKGGGSFKIDHPLDPENKYLYHSFVESPDMMNIYNGNITTDASGNAVIELPDYFSALNKDFRYQLTVVGTFAQAIVAEKVKDNRFAIKTNAPNVEVSWQVTGIRQDAFANKNRIHVEEAKPETERGLYLHPEVFHQPEEKNVLTVQHPELIRQMKEQREKTGRQKNQ